MGFERMLQRPRGGLLQSYELQPPADSTGPRGSRGWPQKYPSPGPRDSNVAAGPTDPYLAQTEDSAEPDWKPMLLPITPQSALANFGAVIECMIGRLRVLLYIAGL